MDEDERDSSSDSSSSTVSSSSSSSHGEDGADEPEEDLVEAFLDFWGDGALESLEGTDDDGREGVDGGNVGSEETRRSDGSGDARRPGIGSYTYGGSSSSAAPPPPPDDRPGMFGRPVGMADVTVVLPGVGNIS